MAGYSGSWQHAFALRLREEAMCNAFSADSTLTHIHISTWRLRLCGGATLMLHAFPQQMHHVLIDA